MRAHRLQYDRKFNRPTGASSLKRLDGDGQRSSGAYGSSHNALKILDRVSTSFFFTGFSDEWQRSAMWRFFKSFVNVVDVFVPHKRSSNGKRFGFVWYMGVENERKLVDEITATWAGNARLILNKAKFKDPVGPPSF